jgi:DNA-binding response OmpR family regulator
MNIRESFGTRGTVSDRDSWKHGAGDSVASVDVGSRTRPAGIIVSDNSEEIGAFLSEFYDVHCYTDHNVRLVACHFDATELQFVILGWADREPTLAALAWIRTISNSPVIVTGPASEPECVAALEGGAADYVVASVGKRELLARIHAVLRYHQPLAKTRQPAAKTKSFAEKDIYQFGQWQYDARKRRLTDPRGLYVALTRSDFALLNAFLKAPGRVLTREYLLNAATRIAGLDRSVDVRILRLRRKLSAVAPGENIISTERGVGYRFAMPVKRHSLQPADLEREKAST